MQGILMKPDMIQAVIACRKTNTRRADASLREINKEPDKWVCNMLPIGTLACKKWIGTHYIYYPNIKPRYHVGETVYIKETYKRWCPDGAWNVRYKDGSIKRTDVAGDPQMDDEFLVEPIKWSNARTMPGWAARHFIFIEAVRPERLQQIGQTDIRLEGIELTKMKPDEEWHHHIIANITKFKAVWNSINPKHPWESNDWVWRYQFRLES